MAESGCDREVVDMIEPVFQYRGRRSPEALNPFSRIHRDIAGMPLPLGTPTDEESRALTPRCRRIRACPVQSRPLDLLRKNVLCMH